MASVDEEKSKPKLKHLKNRRRKLLKVHFWQLQSLKKPFTVIFFCPSLITCAAKMCHTRRDAFWINCMVAMSRSTNFKSALCSS